MKISKILAKNFKILLRSKISSIIIFVGPMLIILLVGISFNKTASFSLNIGVYSPEYNELSESIIDKLSSQDYLVKKYSDQELCKTDIKHGVTHTCVVFPLDFRIEDQKTNEITFYVDKSKINLVYLILNTLNTGIVDRSSEISYNLTSNIVDTLASTQNGLKDASANSKSLLEREKTAETDISGVLEQLKALDLSMSGSVDTSKIESYTLTIQSAYLGSRSKILSKIDTSMPIALEIRDDLESENESTTDINSLISQLESINSTMNSNTTENDLNSLLDEIEMLNKNIGDMSTKLSNAQTAKSDSVKKLESIKSNVADMKRDLDTLSESLSSMLAKIEQIAVTNPDVISNPITTTIEPIVPEKSGLSYMFPSLVMLIIVFMGLLLPSILIIMEKKSKAYFRIFSTPTSDSIFILTTYLTAIILITFQLLIVLLVSHFYFKIDMFSDIAILSGLLFSVTSLFIFGGMLIGYIFNSEEMASIASISIASLLLMTSGLVIPLETMPKYIIEKAMYNPFIVGSEMLKKIILFDVSFESLRSGFELLVVYSVSLLVLMLLFQKMSKIRFLHRKPKQERIEDLKGKFKVCDKKVGNLCEFVECLETMKEPEFKGLVAQNSISEWVRLVLKDQKLALKISKLKKRKDIITLLKK